ncbi:hypothetical protein FPSE_04819 [Fusarium pseudograminearum CS3096]|uniref:Uncharacterized protein n=1 Tax=Fusarium pseudograminearum (strain CS3096) TaxID=1028729 RepID=K3VKG0_FUSPC|nr:hypothetical protein FPSE_04819 [Fusarium pseudograminearum CS3096]EKJ74999.1 hypothetical protein FPSE_04819 [Fusarium pseudograminearum CS3096]
MALAKFHYPSWRPPWLNIEDPSELKEIKVQFYIL